MIKERVKYNFVDFLGIGLSGLCTIHCLASSFFMMSLPILARYYLANPYIHIFLTIFILPIGTVAFILGFRAHRNLKIFALGVASVIAVGGIPASVHLLHAKINEPLYLGIASILLIAAHGMNQRKLAQVQASRKINSQL
jgi:hypothetical protein